MFCSYRLDDHVGSTPGSCPCPLGSPFSSMSENSESDSLDDMAAAAVTVVAGMEDDGGSGGPTDDDGSISGSSIEST